uniref:Uncharacterized protein n=1 Tax=Oryza barthii TaxID=65489 RepID=A0A0D3ERW1_9ORYZ
MRPLSAPRPRPLPQAHPCLPDDHLHHQHSMECKSEAGFNLEHLETQNHKEMFTLMYHVIMGDDPDLKTGKPSPDLFLACCYEEV